MNLYATSTWTFIDDGQIATHIAKKGYSSETGARPLRNTVDREIATKLIDQFSRESGEVGDTMNQRPLPNYEVQLVTVGGDLEKIQVKRFGSKQALARAGG